MFNRVAPVRDAFTLSLGGLTTISSFVAATAIADDQANLVRDDRVNQVQLDSDWSQRVSFGRNRMAVQLNCA